MRAKSSWVGLGSEGEEEEEEVNPEEREKIDLKPLRVR